jgi:hypothetical protein
MSPILVGRKIGHANQNSSLGNRTIVKGWKLCGHFRGDEKREDGGEHGTEHRQFEHDDDVCPIRNRGMPPVLIGHALCVSDVSR